MPLRSSKKVRTCCLLTRKKVDISPAVGSYASTLLTKAHHKYIMKAYHHLYLTSRLSEYSCFLTWKISITDRYGSWFATAYFLGGKGPYPAFLWSLMGRHPWETETVAAPHFIQTQASLWGCWKDKLLAGLITNNGLLIYPNFFR